jgi:Uma2 family endonuclease
VRIPDVSFVSNERLRAWKGRSEPIPSIAPDLAIDILSEGNTPAEMRRKLREYFDAGTNLVWIIDPATRTAEVYTSADRVQQIAADGMLVGGNVLPGFAIQLGELFSETDKMLNWAE